MTDLDGAASLPGPVGRGRGRVHRRPRRQPPRVQLAARGHGVRARVIEAIDRGEVAAEPTGAMRAVDRRRRARPHRRARDRRRRSPRRRRATARCTAARARERLQRGDDDGRGCAPQRGQPRARPALVVDEVMALRRRRDRSPAAAETHNLATVAHGILARGDGARGEPGRAHAIRLPRRSTTDVRSVRLVLR